VPRSCIHFQNDNPDSQIGFANNQLQLSQLGTPVDGVDCLRKEEILHQKIYRVGQESLGISWLPLEKKLETLAESTAPIEQNQFPLRIANKIGVVTRRNCYPSSE
jgi:hypothetical protein